MPATVEQAGAWREAWVGDLRVSRQTFGRLFTVVVHRWGGGESWTRYVVLPRPVAGRMFRAVVEEWVAPVTGESAYSPTGRTFWRAPRVIRRRRVVVIQQSGGLDV